MADLDRDRFDAQVAFATAPARAQPEVEPSGEPPATPRGRWVLRLPLKLARFLLRPLLRPVLARLRHQIADAVRQELLLAQEQARTESQHRLQQQLDRIDTARDCLAAAQRAQGEEIRLVYTGLIDAIHAAGTAVDTSLGQVQDRAEATLARIDSAGAAQARSAAAAARYQEQLLGQQASLHARLEQQAQTFHAGLAQQAAEQAEHQRQATAQTTAMQARVDSLAAGLSAQLALQIQTLQGAITQLEHIENYALAGARRVALPCGGGDMLVRSEAGYVLCSDTDLSVLSTLVEIGDLERGTRVLIESLLRPGDVFVDVGANIGMHTLAAGRAMAAQGTMIVFEPFEPTRRLLEKSVWINGFGPITRIHGCAVSDRVGAQPLFLGQSSGHHSLFTLGEGTPSSQVEVRTVRLDDVIEPALRVTLLKIDAEGAELAVLAGAAATVCNSPDIALIVEFGPTHLSRTGQDPAAWLAAFEAYGFVYRVIDPYSGALAQRSLAELEALESSNLLFARPGSPVWRNTKETA